jgi:hypothetical protein
LITYHDPHFTGKEMKIGKTEWLMEAAKVMEELWSNQALECSYSIV